MGVSVGDELRKLRNATLSWYNGKAMTADYRLEPSPRGVVIRFKRRKHAEEYKRFARLSELVPKDVKMQLVKTTYVDGYIWSEETMK